MRTCVTSHFITQVNINSDRNTVFLLVSYWFCFSHFLLSYGEVSVVLRQDLAMYPGLALNLLQSFCPHVLTNEIRSTWRTWLSFIILQVGYLLYRSEIVHLSCQFDEISHHLGVSSQEYLD